jgi:hypothetical protein
MQHKLAQAVGLGIVVFFTAALVVRLVPAGADNATPPNLAPRVEMSRWAARTRLGPFDLHDPRLVAASCAEDGMWSLLTYESPITTKRTTITVDLREDLSVASVSPPAALKTAPGWCDRVPAMLPAHDIPPTE